MRFFIILKRWVGNLRIKVYWMFFVKFLKIVGYLIWVFRVMNIYGGIGGMEMS